MSDKNAVAEYGNIRDLIESCYQELKRQSRRKMARERRNHSWTESVLVNELVERLLRSEATIPLNESEFYRFASAAMSNLLSEHARRRTAQKRRYDKRQYLELQNVVDEVTPDKLTSEQWLDLQQFLDEIAKENQRAVEVFRMRSQGFTNREAAQSHGISEPQASADYRRVVAHLIMRFDSTEESEDTDELPGNKTMPFDSNDDDGEDTPDDQCQPDH